MLLTSPLVLAHQGEVIIVKIYLVIYYNSLYYEHSWFDFRIYNLDLTTSYNQLFTYRDLLRSRFLIDLSINLSPWWKTHREFYLKMKIMSYEIILLVINKTLSSVMRYLCIYSTYEVGLYNENWLTPCFGRQPSSRHRHL